MNQISGNVKHLNVQEPKACGLQWVSECWTSPGLKWSKPIVGLLNGQIFSLFQTVSDYQARIPTFWMPFCLKL